MYCDLFFDRVRYLTPFTFLNENFGILQICFLKHDNTFRKTSLCYEKLIKKFSLNLESGAGVKLIFENR
jgi:hypothetical protein